MTLLELSLSLTHPIVQGKEESKKGELNTQKVERVNIGWRDQEEIIQQHVAGREKLNKGTHDISLLLGSHDIDN